MLISLPVGLWRESKFNIRFDEELWGYMNQRTKGIICIIISAFCFTLMNVCVKAAGDLPSMEKSARAILLRSRTPIRVKRENFKYLFARAFFGTFGIICNFYAVDHLVISDASMLNKMSPFFVIIFSFLILKEKLTPIQVTAVVGAFAGSLLVIKPTFANMDLMPSLIGFTGGLMAGIAYTMVRLLGQKGESGSVIVFFFSAYSCLFALPYLLFFYKPMAPLQLLAMIGAGVAATGGQFCITRAYIYAPGREISVYDYTQIIFSAILGFILFGQVPDRYSILGYIVIVGMAVMMFIYNNRQDKLEKSKMA